MDEIILTPSASGENCLGNGEHEGIECHCDECDNFLLCFPNWRAMMNERGDTHERT